MIACDHLRGEPVEVLLLRWT